MNVLLITLVLAEAAFCDHWQEREKLIREDGERAVGADLVLDDNETKLNEVLMRLKLRELDEGFADPGKFLPAQHFFHARTGVERSEVFEFISRVPKGASLHGHDSALLSGEGLFNLTYRENLYACGDFGELKLQFFKAPPLDGCAWRLVSELRKADPNFDDYLRGELSLIVDNPAEAYPNINVVWSRFTSLFVRIIPMITYKPVFEEYFYNVLQELYDDNVKYIEFRTELPHVYDLDGNVYKEMEVARIYKTVNDLFKTTNSDFLGARLIYGPRRLVDNTTMRHYMETATMLKREYGDFMAGFDLVGQEDLGEPLSEFISDLQELPKTMNLYFHAGETNWHGATTDINIFDAILLGTKRIGHGFSIVKHPRLMEIVKQRKIAVEISPISNQVLELVDDIRNHPGNILIANGLPVVIGNDDPQFWGSKGLSYDWYMAFMGMTSRNADLRFLKQIAMNSLLYSGLDVDFTMHAITQWENDWQKFVENMLLYYSKT